MRFLIFWLVVGRLLFFDAIFKWDGGMVELILRIDGKGRVLIPAEVRRQMGFRDIVKVHVEPDRLILEPVRDPLEELKSLVLDREGDIEVDIVAFRRAAEEALKRSKYGYDGC